MRKRTNNESIKNQGDQYRPFWKVSLSKAWF